MRRAAIASGTLVAAGGVVERYVPQYSPIGRTRAVAPVLIGLGVLAAGAAGYVVGSYTGDDVDKEYQAAEAFEDHLNIYNDAREIHDVTDDQLLASLERDATALQDTARENAIMAAYEAVGTGASREEAQTMVEDTIAETFAVPQKSVATRVNTIANGILQRGLDHGILYTKNPYDGGTYTSPEASRSFSEKQVTMLDGEDVTVTYVNQDGGVTENPMIWDPFDGNRGDGNEDFAAVITGVEPPDPADYSGIDGSDYDLDHVDGRQVIVNSDEYADLLAKIEDEYNTVLGEVEDILTNHYDDIAAGDLSLSDMLAPGAMMDLVAEAESWQEASVYFRALGMPEAVEPCRISFDLSDTETVDGDNTTDDNTTDTTDDGTTEEVTYDGLLGWTLSDDVEGNDLPVGSLIVPDNYPGSFYFAMEYEDDSGNMVGEVVEITGEFVIEGVNSGSEVLEFETRNVASADTSPQDAIDIFEQHRESEKQARDQTIEVVLEETSDDSLFGPIFPSDGSGEIVGLAIIGATILVVISFVTDLVTPGR